MVNKFFKFLMAGLLVSFGATALAQCIPMNGPGPPRLWDGERGCYVPQGTPSLAQMQQQWHHGGQQVIVGPGGQQMVVYPQGYQNQMQAVPQALALANGFTKCEAIGGLTGATLGSFAKNHRPQAMILGALAGGIFGSAICNNGQGQQVMVQQGGGQQVYPQGGGQVVPQQVSNPCDPRNGHAAGSRQGILRLPGHPMDGKTVCAQPGDTNISQWL